MDLKAITILTATSSSVLVFDAVERKVNSVKKKEVDYQCRSLRKSLSRFSFPGGKFLLLSLP